MGIKISGFELLEWAGSFVGYDTHLRYQLRMAPSFTAPLVAPWMGAY